MSAIAHLCLRSAFAVVILASSTSAEAQKMKTTDVAGTIAYLLRIQDGLCPRITFDPIRMSKMIDPKGISVAVLKRTYKADFDESYREAGLRIAEEGAPAFCGLIRSMFDGNDDAFPGLVFH